MRKSGSSPARAKEFIILAAVVLAIVGSGCSKGKGGQAARQLTAPVLVAKGQELVALRIRQIAEENDVPIVENPPLARALYATVELDREIPPQHYKAVAEVISYVFRLKGKLRN